MITTNQAKEWLRILNNDSDELIGRLLSRSQAIIKASTGVGYDYEDYVDVDKYPQIDDLYNTAQTMIVTNLFNEVDEDPHSLTSVLIQLEMEYLRWKKDNEIT